MDWAENPMDSLIICLPVRFDRHVNWNRRCNLPQNSLLYTKITFWQFIFSTRGNNHNGLTRLVRKRAINQTLVARGWLSWLLGWVGLTTLIFTEVWLLSALGKLILVLMLTEMCIVKYKRWAVARKWDVKYLIYLPWLIFVTHQSLKSRTVVF